MPTDARTLVVVTRVAIRLGRNPPPDAAWVEHRLGLLARFATPALARVRVPVTWIWRVASEHLGRVRAAAPAGIHVVDETAVELPEILGDRFLVARLDADDAWLPAALALLARYVDDPRPDILYDLPDGWQYDLGTGRVGRVTFRGRWQGPFLAVTQETRARMLDVGGNHVHAREGRTVRTIPGPAWLQVLHDRNVSNYWRAAGSVPAAGVLARFGVAP